MTPDTQHHTHIWTGESVAEARPGYQFVSHMHGFDIMKHPDSRYPQLLGPCVDGRVCCRELYAWDWATRLKLTVAQYEEIKAFCDTLTALTS